MLTSLLSIKAKAISLIPHTFNSSPLIIKVNREFMMILCYSGNSLSGSLTQKRKIMHPIIPTMKLSKNGALGENTS